MPETATTGNLADAQNTIIREARYTQEANSPSWQLIEKVRLPKGASTVKVPKVGQFTIANLTDGTDLTTEQSINMTLVDLTATERGAKIIITDKLARQNGTTDIFRMVGKQFGDAAARKQDQDVQALYAGLNGGTAFGAAGATFSLSNFAATIAKAMGGGGSSGDSDGSEPFDPDYAVHHPHAVYNVVKSATAIGAGTDQRVNDRREEKFLRRFFTGIAFNGVDLFESKNLFIDSSGDVTGALAQRDALIGLTSVDWRTERERNASLRATEVVFTSDYGVFELDDNHGAPLLYDATAPTDTA
jgi:hypothetical protein